ncbi:tRNA adenosine(34) deaminase TadA [Weissella coleopterorum]|uniref:tRNA adenosine(34) deaminase TadA n=1 Tax=Weissella coleopterorum TaxID=2714949 RepID=UPI001981AB84|nr:tRNA adenosine(34) deaminase TadA [Weissella coleopterorum]
MTILTETQIHTWMGEALGEAKKAYALGEVPIGAVVVLDGQIIGRGFNLRERFEDPSQHAEFQAVLEASRHQKSWRLPDAHLFVTIEPCIMCAGLLQQARIKTVYYGAEDPKAGGVHSMYHLLEDERLNHQVEVHQGIRATEASALMKAFFKAIRIRQKAAKKARRQREDQN